MNVIAIKERAEMAPDYTPNQLATLCKAMASWFVRLDNSYYDVDDLSHKRSRVDIEQTTLIRFGQEFPQVPLSQPLVAAVFKRVINTRHTDITESILPWTGRVVCRPGDTRRIIVERGAATINSWRVPDYRTLGVKDVSFGVAGEFLDWILPRKEERDMIVNWLSWSLKHEGDKPNWAPFFYSSSMGTGKSALARLLIRLFGEQNSITQNNIDKLTSRFNTTLLRSKFVVCEEVNLKPGAADANTLKTYITEQNTAAEAKGKETERVEQRVCMMLTSNHMPFWIEPEDRRYYIVKVDHEGCARGPRAAEFAELVGKLEAWSQDDSNIARLYNALMAMQLPADFSAKTLNVERDGTEIMKTIFGNGRATIVDQLKEHLDDIGLNAVPEANVVEIVQKHLKGNINSTKHLMSDLGWTKREVKWGKVDYARQLWVRPGYLVQNGKLVGPDAQEVALGDHLKRYERGLDLM